MHIVYFYFYFCKHIENQRESFLSKRVNIAQIKSHKYCRIINGVTRAVRQNPEVAGNTRRCV